MATYTAPSGTEPHEAQVQQLIGASTLSFALAPLLQNAAPAHARACKVWFSSRQRSHRLSLIRHRNTTSAVPIRNQHLRSIGL
jgi:hypothetical protein